MRREVESLSCVYMYIYIHILKNTVKSFMYTTTHVFACTFAASQVPKRKKKKSDKQYCACKTHTPLNFADDLIIIAVVYATDGKKT